ncbi:kinase-like domain-containing protein [Flagelloscypha sp. PMI_526]|nr:kinase-like domain-containing protein [Flagelloscypha sp. PMI_526]
MFSEDQTEYLAVGLAIICAGASQLTSSTWEFPRRGRAVLVSYGAFWISYAILWIPGLGIVVANYETELYENVLGLFFISWVFVTLLSLIISFRRKNMRLSIFCSFISLSFVLVSLLLLQQPSSFAKRRNYKIQAVLGEGSYGTVTRASWRVPSKQAQSVFGHQWNSSQQDRRVNVALKIIPKTKGQLNDSAVWDEVNILDGLDHPNIIKFFEWFESRTKYYLSFELAAGGELSERVYDQISFGEPEAIGIVRQLLDGVKYLHDHDIVHRDLKPENIIYRTNDTDSSIVIIDFGISKHLHTATEQAEKVSGSYGFVAPEMLNKQRYGKKVDIWSTGIITYFLLGGYLPFRSEDPDERLEEVTGAYVVFQERYWENVSREAKLFILRLLEPQADDRPSAEEALRDPWLASWP